MKDISMYTLPNNQPVLALDCSAFESLTNKEKLYAHYLSQAGWYGNLINYAQVSPESPAIVALLIGIYREESVSDLKKKSLDNGVTDDEFTAFLVYSAGIFYNAGNYKGFGDTKIVPKMPRSTFDLIVKKSKAYQQNPETLEKLWTQISDSMFCLDEKSTSLGYPDQGVTTYFSWNCTESDLQLVNEFAQSKDMYLFNTRCFKTGPQSFEVRLASIQTGVFLAEEVFKGATFKITRGDYDLLLMPVVENMKRAKEHASNDHEVGMLTKYVESFESGSLLDHEAGARFCVQNKNPTVEVNMGFAPNYRDPSGHRSEFHTFVVMVDKKASKLYEKLVDRAELFRSRFPWDRAFTLQTSQPPNFNSANVLIWAQSGIPLGMSYPKYVKVYEEFGGKMVSLINVASAGLKTSAMAFLGDADQEMMRKYKMSSGEVEVGFHELLGHGSEMLFKEEADGTFNFDRQNLKSPVTNEVFQTWYKPGQNYYSVFGKLAKPYEECRAEGVGYYLCLEREAWRILEFPENEIDGNIYTSWLTLFWSGCKSLQAYHPATKKWMQAHSQARFVLLRVCVEETKDFVKIEETEGGRNLLLTMERSKLQTEGKRAIGEFLLKLNTYYCSADIKNAKALFDRYSEVGNDGIYPWARWRDIVLMHENPRNFYVQPNTYLDENGSVKLKTYEASLEGCIQSYVDRFPVLALDNLVKVAARDAKYFTR